MNTARQIAHEIPAFYLPNVPPANETGHDPVTDWLALRPMRARVLERVERIGAKGAHAYTAEIRLGAVDDELPTWTLVHTIYLHVGGGTREDLRELVRGWLSARGVRRRTWVRGKQNALARIEGDQAAARAANDGAR